ncbi:hypothetical protein MF672_026555 [Actinomadura sp. ATCC 31491]|uniref:Carbamoyltransferase HypF n=1 Tax=Actinomadura luzonensis TaxID=2805427 RepID=A0ABT0FYU2_9ACTN|nr:hypothetical protein [Actinomadura luzonensis]MCK2217323.1 hypothetical protein [Actinomadura luzonensis]
MASPRPLVAFGAGAAPAFALAAGDRAFLAPTLDDPSGLGPGRAEAADVALERLVALAGVEPVHAVHDLDPTGPAARQARRWHRRTAVQHHHAHAAAVAAEHLLEPPFLALVCDGRPAPAGDGTLWGGELLLATYTACRRLGSLSRPSRPRSGLPELYRAAAALLGPVTGLRADTDPEAYPEAEPLAWRLERRDGLWVYDTTATLRHLREAKEAGEPPARIAAALHATVAAVTVLMCERAADACDVTRVCLAGDVFDQRLPLAGVLARLTTAGFEAYAGERVPVGCGGVGLGQAAIAAARLSCA